MHSLRFTLKKTLIKLTIAILGIVNCIGIVSPVKSEDFDMPTCPASGSADATLDYIWNNQEGFCLFTPEKYEITIYEMGICTSNPLPGGEGSMTFDKTTCVLTMKNSAGFTVDLAASNLQNLPGGDKPSEGTYRYGFIIISKNFTFKGSYQLANGITYYSRQGTDEYGPYGIADSSLSASQEHEALLNDLGFDDTWGAEMTAQTMPGGGSVTALLLTSSNEKATSKASAEKVIASFETNSGSPIVITNSTKGLEVELKVTDSGYALEMGEENDIEAFGGSPFKPIFTPF